MTTATTSTGQAIPTSREWGERKAIPGRMGAPFKLERSRAGIEEGTTERFTVWIDDDPRHEPHDHPWPFTSTLLSGGYTEDRYRQDRSGQWRKIGTVTYRKGDTVHVPAGDAHVVYDVLPGTTTHMLIGKLTAGPRDWGHLVIDESGDLQWMQNVASPEFLQALAVLNTPPA